MEKKQIICKAEEFAKEKMKGFDPGHDWWHVQRVRKIAKQINSAEVVADPFILDLCAILHDVADSKFSESNGYGEIEDFLMNSGLNVINERIINVLRNISFSNKRPVGDTTDPVLAVLQDADRLDATGALGVARAFSYGAFKGNPFYIPSDETGGLTGTTIHHFYDKLLKLKDLMNTGEGRRLAEQRHNFLEIFLQQFYREWNN